MSNKLSNKKDINTTNKRKKLDPVSFWMLVIFSIVLISLFVFLVYSFITTKPEAPVKITELLEVKAPDFSVMEPASTAEFVPTEKVEGTIGFDAFLDVTKERKRESLDNIRGIIGDELYIEYLNGLDSEYFKKSVEYDYNDFLNDLDSMIKESDYIEALYNLYATENEMPKYEKCHDEECNLLTFIETYTRGELYDYLRERHDMWESILEVEAARTNVDDSYINLFYQDEVCDDYSYITQIEVEVMMLTKEQYDMGYDVLQEAYDKGYIPTKIINETTRNYLEAFSLYRDIDYYTGDFKDLAVDTFNTYFASEVINNSMYLGEIATDSNAGTKEEQLKKMLEGVEQPVVEEKDWSALENWNVERFSLEDRNEDDLLYILWKIVPGSCEHTLEIPAKSVIEEELEEKARYYIADRLIGDTIYAEMNKLTEEEVHELLKSRYGYTDEELDGMSEDELRTELEVQEANESLGVDEEAQANLDEIKTHLEEHGYDLTGMTDMEIVKLYTEEHPEVLESN